MNSQNYRIFKNGSTTYFYSSLFFPEPVKTNVFTFYAFVRTADDLVDATPQKARQFYQFKRHYHRALEGKKVKNDVITNFVSLIKQFDIPTEWVEAFFTAMQSDLHHRPCHTLTQTKAYMYGSAEVIGLVMAKILNLPPASYATAALQGRAMQFANFIRDIAEDNALGRLYLPQQELKAFGLKNLSETEASKNPQAFQAFLSRQINRYQSWQDQAQAGYQFLPFRYRLPVKTAADMYTWTLMRIKHDPFLVYRQKIKPSKFRVVATIFTNTFRLLDPCAYKVPCFSVHESNLPSA